MGIVSTGCVSTLVAVAYLYVSMMALYRLMNPLYGVDLSTHPVERMVKPLWNMEQNEFRVLIFLSQKEQFAMDFLSADDGSVVEEEEENNSGSGRSGSNSRVVLLWDAVSSPSSPMTKSFVLTTENALEREEEDGINVSTAKTWFDPEEEAFSIGSSSFLLSLYGYVTTLFNIGSSDEEKPPKDSDSADTVYLDPSSDIWKALMKNSTVFAHVVLIQLSSSSESPSTVLPPLSQGLYARQNAFRRLVQQNRLQAGQVALVKHDVPLVIKPTRILYHDLYYLFQRYILQNTQLTPPWHLKETQPVPFAHYEKALLDKQNKVGFPFWKPEVAVRLVAENIPYPVDLVERSGMDIIALKKDKHIHPTGYAYLPPIHVDEMGLTSEKYVPINNTVHAFPLKISLNTDTNTTTALSPQRWRLLHHMTQNLNKQRDSGLFEESDIDDVKRLIADTNVSLLTFTLLATVLHMLFEFLTFKSDVEFWKDNTDLTGLSVRALFLDVIFQIVVLLYLIEMDSSLLMTAPAAIGILIAIWKCHQGAGFKLIKLKMSQYATNNQQTLTWYNRLFRLLGYELLATRMRHDSSVSSNKDEKVDAATLKKRELAILSDDMDRFATSSLGSILSPFVLFYALYTLVQDEYTGWYSWLITTASTAVYALGFCLMTPQLFINHKLKSVAHLPWRVLCYKFLNTFIDDLFAFIIRMPTMARLSCFRDDIVFVVYLVQRYMYPVDTSRPVEGGGTVAVENNDGEDKKNK